MISTILSYLEAVYAREKGTLAKIGQIFAKKEKNYS